MTGPERRPPHPVWHRALAARAQAVLLALVFLAANFGLPEADVLLDHGVGAARHLPHDHLEGAGGCRDHDGHCVLGHLLTELRLQAPALPAGPLRPPIAFAIRHRDTPRSGPSATTASHHARDPPSPLA